MIGMIMHRITSIFLFALLVGCDGRAYSGFGYDADYSGCLGCPCANVETQQTAISRPGGKCPRGWVHGSINECTNIETGKLELQLMSDQDQCPDGYKGGEVHDFCVLEPPTLGFNELCI